MWLYDFVAELRTCVWKRNPLVDENLWEHEFLGLCWVLICKSCLFLDFSRGRQLSFLSCQSEEDGKFWGLGPTSFSYMILSGNMLSWLRKFLRVLSTSCWRVIFKQLILPVLERQEVQKGKAHLLSSSILLAFLETNQFYPNPLAGRNLRELAHCWHYVPWRTCLHWKSKRCWKPGLIMDFKPSKGLQTTKEQPQPNREWHFRKSLCYLSISCILEMV